MRSFLAMTMISWETRNWRHSQKARTYCRDYGLQPVTQQLFIGELYQKEKNTLESLFQKIFVKKTEKIFIAVLCKSCALEIAADVKNEIVEHQSFEIINSGKRRVKI